MFGGPMLLNFQPFLAMFAGQKEKPAVLGQHFTQTDNTDCYLLNWRLSARSSHVGTGLGRKTTHRQAHRTSQGGLQPPTVPATCAGPGYQM